MKKWTALLLVVMMMLNASGAFALSSDYRDWTNWPVTEEDLTVKIAIMLDGSASDWTLEKNWFFNWASEKTGLAFEMDGILSSALSERKALMFASDDLPDVLWGFGLTPVELVKYGTDEGQLMALNEYITPEIMPNLCAWLEAYPQTFDSITAPDGNIYSLPHFYKVKRPAGGSTRVFISEKYLGELGLEKPQTLEELNEALYAFKAAYPDKTPIGASVNSYDIRDYFLNAMGYLTAGSNDYGAAYAIRDGELVIPCADETFVEFLKLMNQYYNDGIISQDYFLLDAATVEASLLNNENMLQEGTTLGSDYEAWNNWSAAYPLTSSQNGERQWLSANLFQTGGFAISSYCEHPVEILKFVDFLFSDMGLIWGWFGPADNHEDAKGLENVGYYITESGETKFFGYESGKYTSTYQDALYNCIPSNVKVGNNSHALTEPQLDCSWSVGKALYGCEDTSFEWDVTGIKDNYFRASMEDFVSPYETTEYPYYVYLSAEQSARINELQTVIHPYVQTEVAEFITGARPIEEFPQFVEELESMGVREYEQIYRDATGY